MTLAYRPLGELKMILEGLGEEITYAYEDLVFVHHNQYLLQFGETGDQLMFVANVDTPEAQASQHFQTMKKAVSAKGIFLTNGGRYRLTPAADQTISIEFLEKNRPE
ncbi:hypothetical protein [Desulfobulbus alkaliphilus]|uniref:hypothetical protein n=1 Tax=Desulfobulbus alkaliphilus TaxID=869814 RepID=UPI00196670B2|nr:hypothetical protein [Desulfobulbus alkaliphilus]MBM9535716.1 hypothetical protein [Desulfobulbus alkaliphilus]